MTEEEYYAILEEIELIKIGIRVTDDPYLRDELIEEVEALEKYIEEER